MECNRDEAIRAKAIAERKYSAKDLAGAKKFLAKALQLHPALEGAPQLLAVVEVELVAQKKITETDFDWYGILQVDQVADEATIKKQYRKLALALHPDKNKLAAAEAAFKLVGEANGVLADKGRRLQFDLRRVALQSRAPAAAPNGYHATGHGANGSTSGDGAFWTTCPECKTAFQYKREFMNIRVECQKCHSFFVTEVSLNFFPRNQDRFIPNGFSGGMDFPIFAHHASANFPNFSSYRRSVTVTTSNVNATGTGAKKEAPGTGAKSADVVQQTYEKVRRERVEAERESRRKEKELLKEIKRRSKEEQDKAAKVNSAPKCSHDMNEQTPTKADDPLKEAAMKVDSEKKGSKSRKRPRRKGASSDEDEMEMEIEGLVNDGDEDHNARLAGEAHGSTLRRSLRARNPIVAYTFGDSEDEDDDLVALSKKPRCPQETVVAIEKDGEDARNLKTSLPVANGNSEPGGAAPEQNGSARPDKATNSAQKGGLKGHSGNEINKDKKNEVRSNAESAEKCDGGLSQGHSSKPDHSSEAEWQEYLSIGEKKERRVVNMISSDEVRKSMRSAECHTTSTPKAVDKGKKVMAGVMSGTCEGGGHQGTGRESNHAQNASLATGNSGKAPAVADEVLTGDKGSKPRNSSQKSKSPGGSGTYNKSAAVKEKQQDIQTSFAGRFLRRSHATVAPTKKPARMAPTRKQPSTTCPTHSSDHEVVDITVPDTDFHTFDNDRSEGDITPGQIWAIYDDFDGMPRFYGKITSVQASPFQVGLQWLEPHQLLQRTADWVSSTKVAFACGDFKLGKSAQADQVNIFSHVVEVGKGLRNVMKIYPRKHDVWALYKDWHKKWPDANKDGSKDTEYEMVEVTSDYCDDMGVDVAPLIQIPGFRSVFKRRLGIVDSYKPKDLLRFSHKVPAHRMAGNEGEGLPKDCWELDTASLPLYLISQPV